MYIEAYVFFNGNCEEAFTFYRDALGGELEVSRYEGSPMENQMPVEARNKVMHASLRLKDATLMGADAIGEYERTPGNNFALSLATSDENQARDAFAKLSPGGKVGMELQPTFWGAKLFGMVTDRYGIDWMISCH